MTDEEVEKIKEAKETAAAAAFQVYAARILHTLDGMGLDFEALNNTLHGHSALVQDKKTGKWLLVRCKWDFSTNQAEIDQEIKNASHEAAAAEARAAGL